jgi:protocatechuate 3,4-dioxygenase beta subunit
MKNNLLFRVSLVFMAGCLSILFAMDLLTPSQVQAAETFTGTVFRDYNANGINDGANERGIPGITVTAYDMDGVNQGSILTDSAGNYTLNAGGSGPYRIEFSGWPSYLQPSAQGPDNGSSVQFLEDATNPVDFALFNPNDYNQPNPAIAISRLHNGQNTLAGSGNASVPGILTFNYENIGAEGQAGYIIPTTSVFIPSIGTVWGNAYQRENKFLYTSSLLRRHAGMADGPGYIYLLDYNNGASNTPLVKLNLQNINPANGGAAIDLGSVCRNSPTGGPGNPGCVTAGTGLASDYTLSLHSTDPSVDLDAFAKVGKISFGSIDLSEDDSTLWLVNLNQRALISVDVSAVDNTNDSTFSSSIGDVNQYLLSNLSGIPSCTDGVFRPWAITFHDGYGYLGGVCSAENETTIINTPYNPIAPNTMARRDNSDLSAHVLRFDPNNITGGFTQVVQFALDYRRENHSNGLTYGAAFTTSVWQPWASNWPSDAPDLGDGNSVYHSYAQPILSDIEFADDGSMILGFADRLSMQLGLWNYEPSSGASWNSYSAAVAGDIIKVCWYNDSWVLEGGVGCAVNEPAHPEMLQDDGPSNAGEFFYEDYYQLHREAAKGGLAYLPGSGEIMATFMDPLTFGSGGIRRFDTSDGTMTGAYNVYQGTYPSLTTFYKSNGLGDIEVLSNPAPIEIGNRVWRDDNNNGRQDPGEPAMAGVTVTLYDAAGTQIASAVTDSNGNYLFSSATSSSNTAFVYGITELTPRSDFSVRVDLDQPALAGFSATTPDYNGLTGDIHDSDGDTTLYTGFSSVNLTTGNAGHNNHIYDFGFYRSYSLGNRVWLDTDNDGLLEAGELGIDGVSVSLFLDADEDGIPDTPGTPLATTTTSNGGYYRFDNLHSNSYVVRIDPVNFAVGNALASYTSSSVTSPSANNNIDNDDNGINSSAPASNGIFSHSITLGPAADEPTGETDLSPSGQGTLDNQANMTVDFGFYRLSIGNQLWLDADNDGVIDPGENGVPFAGVRVELYDGATLVAVTTTDATGAYLFDRQTDATGIPTGLGLAPSTNYTVHIPASEFAPGQPLAGFYSSNGASSGIDSSDNGLDMPVPATTGISSAVFSLEPGAATGGASVNNATGTTHNPTLDFGFYTLSLGNLVWLDTNNNGTVDGGENGISGVTVNLYRASDPSTIIATSTTNATGHYLFTGLNEDDYIVEIVPPAGYLSSTGTNASLTGMYEPAPDPDADVTDNDDNGTTSGTVIRSAVVSLKADDEPTGEPATPGYTDPAPDSSSNLTVDFGLYRPLSLGNLIWLDTNNNGLVDAGETGISGVTVELLDSTNTVIATTTTDANGNYLFENLVPGDYIVRIPASEFAAGEPLEDLRSSTGVNGSASGLYEGTLDPDNDVDNDDNGITQGSGAVQSLPITLSLGGEPAAGVDGDDTYGNLTLDFGFFEPASLGDYVWYDDNMNGIQDAGELGVPNVTVTLYDGTGTVIATTTTDASGGYLFDNLIPGDYYVVFSDLPTGYAFVTPDLGGDDALDSDPDAISGQTGNYTLVAGQHEPTVDAGIAQSNTLRLGNLVWADYNDNGLVDAGEPGVSGVTVELLDSTGATVLATTTTDGNGNYLFSNLVPGDYIVRIPASNFAAGGPLENWTSSNAAGAYEPAPDPDNNIDNDDNGTTQGTGDVESLPITLTLLGEPDTAVDGDDTNGNLTVDFGFVPQLASLGDTVWYDTNRDNIQDPSEPGVANVIVRLLDSTGTEIASTTTDANGNYLFDNLVPGIYSVVFDISTLPADYRFVSQDVGGDDALDSDADPTTGATIQTTLTAGENDLTWDAGIYQLASIGDTVWYDSNGDGVQDPGEPGMPNVTVHLLDDTGTVIATTTTDANGNYQFSDLEPGDYAIEVVPPAGYAFTTPDNGSDTDDSDVDPTTGRTIITTLEPGENDPTWDAGLIGIMSIGDLVWNDLNNNGLVDAGETGVANVTVNLYDSSNTLLASTTTDANGNYLFSNLVPGDYIVEIVPPAGYQSSNGSTLGGSGPYEPAPDPNNDINNDDNGTSNGSVIRSGTVTLVANAEPINDGDTDANSNLSIDFGIYQPASLGDRVWHDENQDGIQDSNEPGVPNVTVTLYDSTGTVIATTTTDANGNYLFENLTPGSYSVGFSNLPVGLDTFTAANQGGDDALDSDADPSTGRTPTITLAPGEHNPTIDAGIYSNNPTAISLASFTVRAQAQGNLVEWQTVLEWNTRSFQIYRSNTTDSSQAELVSTQAILAKGSGSSYQWLDNNAQAGQTYYYWLQETDTNGQTNRYGPATVQGSPSNNGYQIFIPTVMR